MDKWHPMHDVIEREPGVWILSTQYGREYGSIELRRVTPDTLRYKALYRGQLLGWATNLRTACERVHAAFLRDQGPGGRPMADWGGSWRSTG